MLLLVFDQDAKWKSFPYSSETVELSLDNSSWEGKINTLSITFTGKKGTQIEIDFIEIERENSNDSSSLDQGE